MANLPQSGDVGNNKGADRTKIPSEKDLLKTKGYILRNTIGEGSYSKVKRACSTILKQDVAIKIICREKAPSVFRERFLPREVEVLSLVQHPQIVKVYEIFETRIPARVYIVTEFLHCGDLLDHVKDQGAVAEIEARCLFVDVCQAVAYLHDNMIAHRDIKCENILLDLSPKRRQGCGFIAKLCDFGFSRRFSKINSNSKSEKIESLTNTFCGSAAYASPEILERKPHNPMLADVWALGIVFFITLYGSMPFDDTNIKAMVQHQKRGDIVSGKSHKIGHQARDFMSRTLRPKPKNRPSVKTLLRHRWLLSNAEEPPSTRESSENNELDRNNVSGS